MEAELDGLAALATALVEGVKGGGQGHGGPAPGTAAAAGLLRLLQIKAANKRLALETEACKEATAASRSALSSADLALSNLLYEKQHYQSAINACNSFVTKFPDSAVALMGVEEFLGSLTDAQEVRGAVLAGRMAGRCGCGVPHGLCVATRQRAQA